jgi:hypothetical protein
LPSFFSFLSLSPVVFFAFWQGVLIAAMVHFDFLIHAKDDWTISNVATATQNFLICIEMVPVSFAYYFTFGYKSFKVTIRHHLFQIIHPFFCCFSLFRHSAKNPALRVQLLEEGPTIVHAVKNFSDVADVTDVFSDTRHALQLEPERQVHQLQEFLQKSPEEQAFQSN